MKIERYRSSTWRDIKRDDEDRKNRETQRRSIKLSFVKEKNKMEATVS